MLHVKCEPGDLHEPGENNVGNKKTLLAFLTVLKTAVEQSALPGRNCCTSLSLLRLQRWGQVGVGALTLCLGEQTPLLHITSVFC